MPELKMQKHNEFRIGFQADKKLIWLQRQWLGYPAVAVKRKLIFVDVYKTPAKSIMFTNAAVLNPGGHSLSLLNRQNPISASTVWGIKFISILPQAPSRTIFLQQLKYIYVYVYIYLHIYIYINKNHNCISMYSYYISLSLLIYICI